MNSLILLNYLEHEAKDNPNVQKLLQRLANCLAARETHNEEALQNENEQLIMQNINMELIRNQFEELCAQQNEMVTAVRQCHALTWRTYEQLKQISWYKLICYDVQNLHWQHQLEMQEAKQKNVQKWQMYQRMEQRHIVQELRVEQTQFKNLQTALENAKKAPNTILKVLWKKFVTLENNRNSKIVEFLKCRKQLEQQKEEIERVNEAVNICKELEMKKQALRNELQQLQAQRPMSIIVSKMQTVEQENSKITTKQNMLKTFELGIKMPAFMDFFNEWETKWQQERDAATIKYMRQQPLNDQTLSDTKNQISEQQIDAQPGQLKTKQIVQKSLKLMQKNTEVDIRKDTATGGGITLNGGALKTAQLSEQAEDGTSAEIITVPSQTQVVGKEKINEIVTLDADNVENVVETEAENGESEEENQEYNYESNEDENNDNDGMDVEKVESKGPELPIEKSEQLNKTGKPIIEIQECRVVKPAGTALPKVLPINLTLESVNSYNDSKDFAATKHITKTSNSKSKAQDRGNTEDFFAQLLKFSCKDNFDDNWEAAKMQAAGKSTKELQQQEVMSAENDVNLYHGSLLELLTTTDDEQVTSNAASVMDFDMEGNDMGNGSPPGQADCPLDFL